MPRLYDFQGDSLLLDIADGIAVATLNRPAQHNALSRELRGNIETLLRDIEADDAVQVLILTGSGEKAFSVGADLKEFEQAPLQPEEMGVDSGVMRAFAALSKPVIAAINGYTVTGGFELAVNCDILVASDNARFADTHVRVGVVPAWGLTQYLTALIGPVRARYLSFTGNYIDAPTARDWGLVLDVVPQAELLAYCRKIAADIISCDRATLVDCRRAMRVGMHRTFEEGLALEAELAKAGLARFDAAGFAAVRGRVMGRGQAQTGVAQTGGAG